MFETKIGQVILPMGDNGFRSSLPSFDSSEHYWNMFYDLLTKWNKELMAMGPHESYKKTPNLYTIQE